MAIEHITNHYELAVARLPMLYRDKPKYLAWLEAYCSKIQEVEDTTWDVFVDRLLQNNPTGDLLAKIGAIVGQHDLTGVDSTYRLLIRARILVNRSTGQKLSMILVAQALTAGLTIRSYDLPMTTFYVQPVGAVTVDPYIMFDDFLSVAIGAGVRLQFVWTEVADIATLTWGDSGGGYSPLVAQSPGDVNSVPVGGGLWAGAI